MRDDEAEVRQATLLVAEDDPAYLIALKDILEEAGFRVLTAENGKAAVKLFMKHAPDLILSDTSMRVMNGFELLKVIRETPQGRITPFVFLSARGTPDASRHQQ